MRIWSSLATLALASGLTVFAQTVPRPAGEFAIAMADGSQTLLSHYAGKIVVLAFISTTCPHCQHTTGVLSKIQNDYASRGVQILAAAFNDDAPTLLPGFLVQFKPTFPVGTASRDSVYEYEQASLAKMNYVPEILFIDRKRVVRSQHGGADDLFKDDVEKGTNQDTNIRAELDTLLKEQPLATSKGHSTTHKTSKATTASSAHKPA